MGDRDGYGHRCRGRRVYPNVFTCSNYDESHLELKIDLKELRMSCTFIGRIGVV